MISQHCEFVISVDVDVDVDMWMDSDTLLSLQSRVYTHREREKEMNWARRAVGTVATVGVLVGANKIHAALWYSGAPPQPVFGVTEEGTAGGGKGNTGEGGVEGVACGGCASFRRSLIAALVLGSGTFVSNAVLSTLMSPKWSPGPPARTMGAAYAMGVVTLLLHQTAVENILLPRSIVRRSGDPDGSGEVDYRTVGANHPEWVVMSPFEMGIFSVVATMIADAVLPLGNAILGRTGRRTELLSRSWSRVFPPSAPSISKVPMRLYLAFALGAAASPLVSYCQVQARAFQALPLPDGDPHVEIDTTKQS